MATYRIAVGKRHKVEARQSTRVSGQLIGLRRDSGPQGKPFKSGKPHRKG